MASSIQETKISGFATYLPAVAQSGLQVYQRTFEENRHRIYSLAFWMMDNELAAEELMGSTFRRVFCFAAQPSAEQVDRALVSELREIMPLGTLTLECSPCEQVYEVRRNTMRVDLERALVRLEATERLIFLMHDVENYDHARIGRTLGVTEEESRNGLHQARLRMRELLASS